MLLCLETSSRSKTHRTSYEDIERRAKERVEKEETRNKNQCFVISIYPAFNESLKKITERLLKGTKIQRIFEIDST